MQSAANRSLSLHFGEGCGRACGGGGPPSSPRRPSFRPSEDNGRTNQTNQTKKEGSARKPRRIGKDVMVTKSDKSDEKGKGSAIGPASIPNRVIGTTAASVLIWRRPAAA